MTRAAAPSRTAEPQRPDRLPWFPLVLLAAVGFLLVSLETLPAGLLPDIAGGMRTTEGVAGQFVSAYAVGAIVATVPAIALTRGMRRKPLLLTAVATLVLANAVTAVSPDLVLSLASRVVAGSASGFIWGLFATYARRISPARYAGRSLAVVSTGAPLGLALGTPLGSVLGSALDWRWSFAALSLVGAIVLALIAVAVPDVPGQPARAGQPVGRVLRRRGILLILAVIAAWMLAHNTIYTYVSPYLQAGGSGLDDGLVLLVYGVAAIGGVVLTGVVLDRAPRALLHGSAVAFVAAALVLLVAPGSPAAVLGAAAIWGVSFGGVATQLQSALTTAGGDDADVASAFVPVAFNVAIFASGVLGAALLTVGGGLASAAVMLVLGVVALLLTLLGRRSAFPAHL